MSANFSSFPHTYNNQIQEVNTIYSDVLIKPPEINFSVATVGGIDNSGSILRIGLNASSIIIGQLNKDIDVVKPVNKKIEPNKSVDDDKNKKKEDDNKKEKEYYDPYAIWFFNKVKENMPSISKGGEPKISNFFDKYGLSGKKVNENIERIKKLL
jgi:hypothetical protein